MSAYSLGDITHFSGKGIHCLGLITQVRETVEDLQGRNCCLKTRSYANLNRQGKCKHKGWGIYGGAANINAFIA